MLFWYAIFSNMLWKSRNCVNVYNVCCLIQGLLFFLDPMISQLIMILSIMALDRTLKTYKFCSETWRWSKGKSSWIIHICFTCLDRRNIFSHKYYDFLHQSINLKSGKKLCSQNWVISISHTRSHAIFKNKNLSWK